MTNPDPMAALEALVPAGHVLRLCASYERLSGEECTVPERCKVQQCRRCNRGVHYDPSASIPLLGPEFILCDICLDEVGP